MKITRCLTTTPHLVLLAILAAAPRSASAATLFSDSFNRPDGLVTNEYAFWNPTDPNSVLSPDWQMDSGSFFIQGQAGWTGIPDDIGPNAKSTNGTNSAIFRLNTKASSYGDVSVSFKLLNQGLTTTSATPAVAWDGCHIWLHYQTEYSLYYASINRRDGTSVIKKKVPGGPSNGGTYYELSPYVSHPVKYNQWVTVTATVKNNTDGTVTIALYENGSLIVQATDNGTIGGAPIRGTGKIGIRGDNANLKFDDFTVSDLGTSSNPLPVVSSLSPATATAGASAFTLTVNGSNFVNGSVIQWNGSARTTTYVSATQLKASITAADAASAGSANVTVFSPTPGGGTSGVLSFTINPAVVNNPVPAVSSLSPTSATAGGAAFALTVNGSNFVNGAAVQWNGSARTTTYVSATQLRVSVTAADIASSGSANVTVVNPAPGGGTSSALAFTIAAAPPPAPSRPSAPSNVVATPGNGQAAISWSPVSGATSYNLYRSRYAPVTPSNGFQILHVTSPFLNTGWTNGTTYYMVVTAVNAAGEGPASAQVSVVPQGTVTTLVVKPTAPTNVTTIPGNGQAAISWSPVPGATSYNLYRSRTSGVTPSNGYQIVNVASPFLNTGWTNGTTYYMVVTALNSAGEGPASLQVSVVPQSVTAPSTATSPAPLATNPTTPVVVSNGLGDLGAARVYPNPWRADQHGGHDIQFDRLTTNSTIKIFTLAGRLVRQLTAPSGSAPWDRKNNAGDLVGSGLYFYVITNEQGQRFRGKLAILR